MQVKYKVFKREEGREPGLQTYYHKVILECITSDIPRSGKNVELYLTAEEYQACPLGTVLTLGIGG
jgi:hypothetical protein